MAAENGRKDSDWEETRSEQFYENPFYDYDLPPCAKFLNNYNPMVNAEGNCIFINYNRVYCFVNLFCQQGDTNPFLQNGLSPFACQSTVNYQISFAHFLLAVLIHQVQLGEVEKKPNMALHPNREMNGLINSLLENPPDVDCGCVPSITLYCTNSNAVAPLYSATTNISPLNFYILLLLILGEQNAGLYLGNNAYVTPDAVNYGLASLYFPCPNGSYTHCGRCSRSKGAEKQEKTCHKRRKKGDNKPCSGKKERKK